MVLAESQHLHHSVNLPLASGSVLLANLADLVGQLFFELGVCDQQIRHQLLHNRLNVSSVRNLVKQVERLLLNDEIVVLQTVNHRGLVTSHGFVVNINHLDELLECHVSYVVLFVLQKFTQNVDTEHS